jgi:hypothetical protein
LEFEDYSYALIIAGANWGALEIFTKIVRRLEKKNYPHIFRVNIIAYFTFYFSFLLMIVNFRA